MKNINTFLACLMTVITLLFSCSPDCETYAVINAEITPTHRLAGEQILVKTNQPDFLLSRELYIEKRINNKSNFEMIESDYMEEAGGRVATLTKGIVETGNQNIYIKDNDCGGYIPLSNLNIVDDAFVSGNPGFFVAPSPPIIFIPSPPIPSPTHIINTWFSPDDPAYCIWFAPILEEESDGNGGTCIREKTMLEPGNVAAGTGTRELRCGGGLYDHENPITGFIDKATGTVDITIDRDSKGLGTEGYIGHIVEPTSLPAAYQVGGRCTGDATESPATIMVLTSQKTGRKLVLYRHADPGAVPDDSELCDY